MTALGGNIRAGQAREERYGDFTLVDQRMERPSQLDETHASISPLRRRSDTLGSERGLLASALAIGCLHFLQTDVVD